MKNILIASILILLVVACAPTSVPAAEPATLPPDLAVTNPPIANPIATESPILPVSPNPGDIKLERGNVFIAESELLIRESYPVQIALVLSGELPTPCHQLRVNINPPDAENKILIEAYTVYNPELNCIQVVKPFQETIDLGSFPSGHYTVWVNDAQVGEFDS